MPCSRHQRVEAKVRHLRDRDEVDAEVEREDRDDPSPSTSSPCSSTASMRSPSPSNAIPRSKPPRQRAAGARRVGGAEADVDVRTVRLVADRLHLAPSRSNARGASRSRRRSRSRRAMRKPVRSEPKRVEHVVEVGVRGAATCSIAPAVSTGPARRAAPRSPSRRRRRAWPGASKSLMPLYSGGLCDAETTTPRSSGASATAGVGRTPPSGPCPRPRRRRAQTPARARGPEARVSRPTKTRRAPLHSVAARPAARRDRWSTCRRRRRARRPCRNSCAPLARGPYWLESAL